MQCTKGISVFTPPCATRLSRVWKGKVECSFGVIRINGKGSLPRFLPSFR